MFLWESRGYCRWYYGWAGTSPAKSRLDPSSFLVIFWWVVCLHQSPKPRLFNHWTLILPCMQIFCICIFMTAATIFGTLVSQIKEIIAENEVLKYIFSEEWSIFYLKNDFMIRLCLCIGGYKGVWWLCWCLPFHQATVLDKELSVEERRSVLRVIWEGPLDFNFSVHFSWVCNM